MSLLPAHQLLQDFHMYLFVCFVCVGFEMCIPIQIYLDTQQQKQINLEFLRKLYQTAHQTRKSYSNVLIPQNVKSRRHLLKTN